MNQYPGLVSLSASVDVLMVVSVRAVVGDVHTVAVETVETG